MRHAKLALASAVLLLQSAAGLTAQERVLKGRIVAKGGAAAVRDAAVRPVGGGAPACTGEDGSFTVVVPSGTAWLEMAVPGWVGRVPVPADAEEVTLQMDPQVVPIAPLIVIAPGGSLREGSSRAELRVSTAEAAPADVRSMLQGRVPGALVLTGSGVTGSGFRMLVRGISSLSGPNEPLVVVDGVVMAGSSAGRDPHFDSGVAASPGGLQNLNPADIEKIEILRGPAASTLYGTLGMNGVVLVTTRHGQRPERPSEDQAELRCPGWQ